MWKRHAIKAATRISSMPPALQSGTTSFYMRDLPTHELVGYESPRGKELFKNGLLAGYMESFFPLSQQFLTQNEPAYCGIGTLTMCLNALHVDPGKVWKQPWRWFTQEMLDCCRPLEDVQKEGITLAEFTCLARCNGLDAQTKFADETSYEEFEAAVKDSTSSGKKFIALSYSRASLGQTGTGHFSPVGGYSAEDGGMALVLDVARFKYPSYWVPMRKLFESLIPLDTKTGQPRGYSILSRREEKIDTSALFSLNLSKDNWQAMLKSAKQCSIGAESVPELVISIIKSLECPVSSRDPGPPAESENEHISPPSPTNSKVNVDLETAYSVEYENLLELLVARSSLYHMLPSDLGDKRAEWAIFMMALFTFRPFLGSLSLTVKDTLTHTMPAELVPAKVEGQVTSIRRQMMGLNTCCCEESRRCESKCS